METNSGFRTEAELAHAGRRVMREAIRSANIDEVRTRSEVRAPGCIPDLVIYRRAAGSVLYVVAVEFKLQRWRRGLSQAFRYRNFGNETYVVVDRAKSNQLVNYIPHFKQANVGLVVLDRSGDTEVLTYPNPSLPFSTRFAKDMARSLLAPRRSLPEDLPFIRSVRGGFALLPFRRFLGSPSVSSEAS